MVSKVWDVMNDLEMTTAKICSAREIIDAAIDKIQKHQYDNAEMMMSAAYEFLEYYLNEFDEKFKLAWQETVVKQKKEEDDAWDAAIKERNYYEGYSGSTVSSVQYTDEELDAMCDKAASEEEKERCQEYNLREVEYVRKEGGYAWTPEQKHSEHYFDYDRNDPNKKNPFELTYDQAITSGWEMTADGFWIPPQKEDRVKKWVLPVQQACAIDNDGEYYVNFPDDLLAAANLKEGDQVEWIDQGDGSYLLKKIEK